MSAAPYSRELSLRTALDACAFVDELGTDAVGEIVVSNGEGACGAVFVERGRICWAAARGLSRRLTELLGARASVPPASMEQMYRACKSERVPIGEYLVRRGILSGDALREALMLHTVESLRHLCGAASRAAWVPREGNGYSPRFTFATGEVAVCSAAAAHEGLAGHLEGVLAGLFSADDWAAAFVRTGGSAAPEPIALRGASPSVTQLLRYGKWAASVLDVVTSFTDDTAFLAAALPHTRSPASLVAFRHEAAIIAGETGVHGAARILNRRAQQRRTRERNADL